MSIICEIFHKKTSKLFVDFLRVWEISGMRCQHAGCLCNSRVWLCVLSFLFISPGVLSRNHFLKWKPMTTYTCSDIHSLSVHQVKHIFSNSIRLKRLNNAWFSLCRTQILSKTRPRDPVSKFRLCVAVPDIWAPLPELGSRDHMLDL